MMAIKTKNSGQKIALSIVLLLSFIAIFNSLIANKNPIIAKQNGLYQYPAFNDMWEDWTGYSNHKSLVSEVFDEVLLSAPITFDAYQISSSNSSLLKPLNKTSNGPIHLLGTDRLGRDVAAGLVRGCYNAFRIGFLSSFFAAIIGILLGLLIGYYGNHKIHVNYAQLILLLLGVTIAAFYMTYGFYLNKPWTIIIWICYLLFISFQFSWFGKIVTKTIQLPIDMIIMRLIEVRKSIPFLIFILALLATFSRPAVTNVIIILTALSWTTFTRHTRAEVMSLVEQDFVKAAIAEGSSTKRIMLHHLLPNILPTISIVFIFSLTTNILIESTLSYLGIGLPIDEISWGSILNEGRKVYSAWWLTFFPGLILFILIYSLNILSDKYSSIID